MQYRRTVLITLISLFLITGTAQAEFVSWEMSDLPLSSDDSLFVRFNLVWPNGCWKSATITTNQLANHLYVNLTEEHSSMPFCLAIWFGYLTKSHSFGQLVPGTYLLTVTYTLDSLATPIFSGSSTRTVLFDGEVDITEGEAPILRWVGEQNVDDGLYPDEGWPDDSYRFMVMYHESSGQAPAPGYPLLRIYTDEVEDLSSPFLPDSIHGDDYASGILYQIWLTDFEPRHEYAYRFEAIDIAGDTALGKGAELRYGPVIWDPNCCGRYTSGFAGNTDCDTGGLRNLADITRLINRIYISKKELCCESAGNVDGDVTDQVNLSDITRLIDHVYVSKEETAACQ